MSSLSSMPSDNGQPKGERIEDRLEYIVSNEDKQRIDGILRKVAVLTDVQKLLLYLKLPTGARSSGLNELSSTSRPDHAIALRWLRTHLQCDTNTCLPKQDILDEYRLYCERHHYQVISQADFGKLVKQVFPDIKTRRLGQRGQSRHCYGGLGTRTSIDPPTLPDIDVECKEEEQVSIGSGEEDSLVSASSSLVCEWAQKLLGQDIPDVVELARYLVSNNYVNGQSHAAFAVLATVHQSTDTSPKDSPGSTGQSVGRPRDVQLQLQRKLQQRGQLRQQKKRLEEQRSRIGDNATTTDQQQQSDDSCVKADKKEEPAPAVVPAPVEKKEPAEKPKEVVSSRVQPVLPKLILPKPASVVATTLGSSSALTGTVSGPGVTAGEMSPSVLLLTPPANTHPQQPMLYLSPQQNSAQQPIVLTPATMGQHWPVNSAPLAFGSVLVSSMPQQTHCTAGAVTSTAGATIRQCLQRPPQHQQLQQLLQQPAHLLPRQQAPVTTRALPRSEAKPAGRVLCDMKTNSHSTAPVSSVCHHQPMGDTTVAPVKAPVSLPSNQSTNLASNPCLAALIRASPTRSCINGPLTFKGGLHLHADLAPGAVHLHTDLAPGGSSMAGAYMESRGMQNTSQHNPQQNSDILEEPAASVCATNAISGACTAQSHTSSPQHNMTHADTGVGSPASGSTPQKPTGKSVSSGKVLKTPAKTVSTLLKEQRGYGPQEDQKAPYVKDKRPVSELLKESRIKRRLHVIQPRLMMVDAAQNGDGNTTPAAMEPSAQFGNTDNGVMIVNMHSLAGQDAAASQKSNVDSPQQSSWSSSSTSHMIQLLLSKTDESQGSSWSSDGSVDMPVAERDSLLGCFSLDMPVDLADVTPSISTVDSCELQSMSSTVATAPAGSRLQQLRLQNRQLEQDMQLKAIFSAQCQGGAQQQRNSAVSFSDCLLAAPTADTSTRRPQSESSIEHYRHQQDLTGLTQPPVAVTSRPGSEVTGVFPNPGFQMQSFMNIPQKCSLSQNNTVPNNIQMAFAHASPATPPLSILSPKTHHRENGSSHSQGAGHSGCQSFTPISGGVNFESRSFVSPVRPKATMGTVAHEHGCVSVASDPERAPLKPVVASDLDGNRGFLPYAAATSSVPGAELSQIFPWLSESVGSAVPVMTFPQESPYGAPQTYNNDGHFAPVSSIRPVKRGRTGSNAGVTKRARHHSAQSSFNVERSSTPLDGGGRACGGPAQNIAIRQQHPVESAAFSPEIQHIMGSDGVLTSQAQAAYNMHRSRSVPAHHVVHDGRHSDDSGCEFSTTAPPDRLCSRGFIDEPSNEEITQLLQDKMDGMAGTARGLHVPPMHEYGARKNLTEMLEAGATQQHQVYSSCRGDHMISGASWRPATLTFGDSARQRFRRSTSYPGEDAALTPPSSQNPTPVDFGGGVATVDQSQSRPCSRQDCMTGGRTFAVATAMHTPSSMDVTGDGREPLDDALFSDVYDDDSPATRGTADSVSPADQLVADSQPMSLEWGLV